MGLKKCSHCQKNVETITDFCPECGDEITVVKKPEVQLNGCSVIGFLFVGFFIFMFLFASPDRTLNQSTRGKTQTKKWYDGGNLHKKTIKEWTQSTRENKLATCADFAAAHPNIKKILEKSDSMELLLPYAMQLVVGIDEYAKETKIGHHKVSETAAMLIILLKW